MHKSKWKTLPVGTRRIFFRGIIDLDGLFKVINNWLSSQKYEFHEKSVKHKITGEGALKEIDWYGSKHVTEFIKFRIEIMFKIRDIVGVEVIKKGEKKKLSQCKILIEINPKVILDPRGRFETSNFLLRLRDWLVEHVLKKEILFGYADQLDYRTLKLQNTIKKYFDFEAKEHAYEKKW